MGDILRNWSVEDLLPHRGCMLLIDEIVRIDTEVALARSRVSESWPLFDGSGVPAFLIIELVAQTCGLFNGLNRIREQGPDSEKRGFLVGIKMAEFKVATLPLRVDILTEARNRFKFETFREVEGVSRIGSALVGQVILQVVQAGAQLT